MNEIIYGKRTVIEALRSGIPVKKLYIFQNMENKDKFLAEIGNLLNKTGVSPKEVSRRELESISGTIKHQGVVAEFEKKDYVSVDEILSYAEKKGEKPFILILNGIEDPHNLGAILRSAEGAGVHGVILPKRRSAKINPTVARTSAGAVYHILISIVSNISQTLEKLKSDGVWIVGSDAKAEKMYYELDFNLPIALVIGSEGKGIQNIIEKKCDFMLKIPMCGKIQSLNASVSAGILLYEVLRQRLERSKV